MEQYSNLNVHGNIKQQASQGTLSDDVVIVSGIAPLSTTPANSTGVKPAYFKGQTAVVSGSTYICSNVTNNAGGGAPTSSTVWTYTWTLMGDPDNVTGPVSSTDGHVVVFNGSTGKVIKDTGLTLGASIPNPSEQLPTVEGKALIVNETGDGFTFGEAGKVDDVKIGSSSIVSSKIATIPDATTSSKGVVQVGTNINVSSGTISVNTATTGQKGVMQVGTTLEVNNGTVNQKSGVGATGTKGSATKVPTVTVDTYGRVTGLTEATVTPAWGSVTGKPSSYTPSAHADPTALYGAGSPSNYGHVKFDETVNSNRQSYTEYIGYTEFNSVNDYVGYYVDSNNTKVKVTDSNKSTLGITAGTTKAYVLSTTVIAISEKGIVDFVNSSIGTATANFLGTFTALEYRPYPDYVNFDSVDDYVDYYVVYNSVYTLVTSSNKSSLGITPGTTKAYTKPEDSLKFTQSQVDQMVDPYSSASEAIASRLGNPGEYHVPSDPSPNDYVFVEMDFSDPATSPDEYRRYKWTGTGWMYEYTLNNSSFTQSQWDAINSTITETDVTKLNGIADGAQVNVIETVKVNNTALTVTSKTVNIPAATTSAFGVVEIGSGTALNVTNGVITSLVTSPGSDVEFINWPA